MKTVLNYCLFKGYYKQYKEIPQTFCLKPEHCPANKTANGLCEGAHFVLSERYIPNIILIHESLAFQGFCKFPCCLLLTIKFSGFVYCTSYLLICLTPVHVNVFNKCESKDEKTPKWKKWRQIIFRQLMWFYYTEAVVQRCFVEEFCKNFTKFIGKHLCKSLFFIKLQALGLQLYEKRDSGTDVFLWFLWNF